jgi:MFS family permease
MTDPDRAANPRSAQPDPGTSGGVLTVLLTSVAYFIVTLDALVVVTALPSIHRDLGGGIGTLQWTVSAYTIAFGAGILTAAALGDRLGRRRVYVAGLALFAAASAACALAPGAGALIACRACQGVGAAVVMPLGLTLLTSAFPAERRGAVVGIWGGIAGLAVACGPLVGGAITQGLSWHWIFWVNVPVGVIAAIGARLRLSESRGPAARLDIPALVLISGGVGILIWGLVQGGQAGWGSAQNLTGLILGAALIAGFVVREAQAPEPMIPLRLFRVTAFSAALSTQFLLAAAIFSAAFLTSQFFQLALGDSPLGAGLRFLPWTATPLLVARANRARFADARGGLRLDRVAGGPFTGLRQLCAPLRRGRHRDIDGSSVRHCRGIERGPACAARQGSGHPEHDAAVRCRVRHRDRDGRLQRHGQSRRPGSGHQRIPPGPRRGGGPVGPRCGRRLGHPQDSTSSRS